MRLPVLLVACVICFGCYGQSHPVYHKKVNDNYIPSLSAEQLYDQLNKTYKRKNFDEFFSNWQHIQPNSEEFIYQNDTTAAIYTIFKNFYRPLDLLRLGDWEWGNRLNENAKYIAVQNTLYFAFDTSQQIDDFNWNKSLRDSIINFRPPVDISEDSVLYLTSEYEDALNEFLGTTSTKLGEGNIMNPSRAKGESEKRYNAIRPYLPVLHGHWGGYWHLSTHPYIFVMIFNPSLDKATILFRVGYQGGKAAFKKSADAWVMVESGTTWIE